MKLKTYTAETMAQALAQVRKDLGKDAMILHTRSYRVGSWLGFGGKNMVEITASSPAPSHGAARSSQRAAAATSGDGNQEPELVIQRGRTLTRQRLSDSAVELKPVAAQLSARGSSADGQSPGTAQDRPREPKVINQSAHRPVAPAGNDIESRIEHGIEHKDGNGAGNGQGSRAGRSQRGIRSARTLGETGGLTGRDALFSDEPMKPARVPMPEREIEHRAEPGTEPTAREPKPDPTRGASDAPVTAGAFVPPAASTTPDPASSSTGSGVRPDEAAQLRAQLESMQKMMGQVLESTRKTAVAVGTGNAGGVLPSGEMPAPLFEAYRRLMDNDVPADLADRFVGAVRDQLDRVELRDPLVVRQALLREIERTIRTRSESLLNIDHSAAGDRPRVIALVGPTGVGKTTTVAKLAATYKLRHSKRVGLITSDTYRIAAVDQLRTYAGIIGLPLKVANTPDEMRESIEQLGACDLIVVDTAGRSQNDRRRLDELAEFARAADADETHLVLSTTVGDNVLRRTAERFRVLSPDRCILTKLDEAVTTGPIAGLCDRIGLPLSFVTLGQEVPDDIEPARADRLARCVLDGPEGVFHREEVDG